MAYNPGMPVHVVSHRRSGTHLLMALIYHNFELPKTAGTIGVPGHKWADTGEDKAVIPWTKLFATHGLPASTDGLLCTDTTALYVVRHPYDTMMSLWRFRGEKGESFEDFATPDRLEEWRTHAVAWAKLMFVRFEDMLREPGYQLDRIHAKFGLTPKQGMRVLQLPMVGWSPGAGLVGQWAMATPEMQARFREHCDCETVREWYRYDLEVE